MIEECPHGMDDPAWCSICKHGPKKPVEVIVEAYFTSRYESQCSSCNLPIYIGQELARLSNGQYVHADCTRKDLWS